jgi:hypothetical protein
MLDGGVRAPFGCPHRIEIYRFDMVDALLPPVHKDGVRTRLALTAGYRYRSILMELSRHAFSINVN